MAVRPLRRAALTLGGLFLLVPSAIAQTDAPMADTPEAHYYDFWPGTWVEVVDGRPDSTATRFVVRRGVHDAAYEEEWRLFYGSEVHRATALRAWDQVHDTWGFVWVSDTGLYQVWDGVEVDGVWHIVKEFEIDGQTFLSRQAWIPEGDDRLVRLMERSFDGGHTWEVRSRTPFVRTADQGGP